ncbi:MAG: hypothetical protein QHC90_09210 [Shinella sp.]|nr:hypothetical protein [Shinella sp.]
MQIEPPGPDVAACLPFSASGAALQRRVSCECKSTWKSYCSAPAPLHSPEQEIAFAQLFIAANASISPLTVIVGYVLRHLWRGLVGMTGGTFFAGTEFRKAAFGLERDDRNWG